MTTRALVLGGGGPVGIAWESGLLAGLAQAGVDLGGADLVMGTSAGSVVGARLAMGAAASSLAEAILAEPPRSAAAGGSDAAPPLTRLMQLMAEAQSGLRNPAEARRALGAYALSAETVSEERFIKILGRALHAPWPEAWPGQSYACTAVDVEDGGFQLWIGESGVELARAVAASCSVPGIFPPVTLKGRRYMDGGMRSATNADLAAGHAVVVVVAVCTPGGSADWMQAQLQQEVESLQAGGSTVVTILPDQASLAAFGENLMDSGRGAKVAQAGLAQGRAQAAVLKAVWG